MVTDSSDPAQETTILTTEIAKGRLAIMAIISMSLQGGPRRTSPQAPQLPGRLRLNVDDLCGPGSETTMLHARASQDQFSDAKGDFGFMVATSSDPAQGP
eukprot:3199386-Heterocapsa_arctica.AAC.1